MLLFSLTQHAGEIDWLYFLQSASFLLFHRVCFPSMLPFPHNLPNATCTTDLHKAVGHEMYTKLTRTRTKRCGHGGTCCRRATARACTWRRKRPHADVLPLETCNSTSSRNNRNLLKRRFIGNSVVLHHLN